MSESVRILVIDDSEDDRSAYRRLLTRAGAQYEVLDAADGEDGLHIAETSNVHCVLLDYSLPGRNGVEVLKRIKAKIPFMPVVMLTGVGNERVAVSAMQAGAQHYLVKSTLTTEEVDRTIQLAIAHCAMEKRIEEQRLSLEIFTRALAHDLKEPARTIKSFISVLMSREPFSADGRRYLGYVHDAADRMTALIDAVYLYTRLDSAATPPAKEACELGAVVQEAQIDLSELIREREATVTVGPMPRVNANRQQLRQVIQNLVSNAIQHCLHDPTIAIDAIERPDSWVIRVADDGPGIDEGQRDKIFDPFVRLAHKAHGLGMGLAICKRVVEMHGGRIWCENRPEGGAMFQFSVPKDEVSEPAAPANRRETPARALPDRKRDDRPLARILVVDDNEAAIELTRIVLIESAKLRCELLSARGAEEAMATLLDAKATGAPIDLVLLDINMPRIDGFELLRRVREIDDFNDLAIVMCTTSTYDKDVDRARHMGAAGFVTKPATLKNLKPVLESVGNVRLSEVDGVCALLRVA